MLRTGFSSLAGLCLGAGMLLFPLGCTSESAPAARDAPRRTMAPEEAEPEVEPIDQRRVEASSMVVIEQEPVARPAVEMEEHDHGEEPGEAMTDEPEKSDGEACPEGAMCAGMGTAPKPASKPVVKPKKSLIR
jgi:hypothetical protein